MFNEDASPKFKKIIDQLESTESGIKALYSYMERCVNRRNIPTEWMKVLEYSMSRNLYAYSTEALLYLEKCPKEILEEAYSTYYNASKTCIFDSAVSKGDWNVVMRLLKAPYANSFDFDAVALKMVQANQYELLVLFQKTIAKKTNFASLGLTKGIWMLCDVGLDHLNETPVCRKSFLNDCQWKYKFYYTTKNRAVYQKLIMDHRVSNIDRAHLYAIEINGRGSTVQTPNLQFTVWDDVLNDPNTPRSILDGGLHLLIQNGIALDKAESLFKAGYLFEEFMLTMVEEGKFASEKCRCDLLEGLLECAAHLTPEILYKTVYRAYKLGNLSDALKVLIKAEGMGPDTIHTVAIKMFQNDFSDDDYESLLMNILKMDKVHPSLGLNAPLFWCIRNGSHTVFEFLSPQMGASVNPSQLVSLSNLEHVTSGKNNLKLQEDGKLLTSPIRQAIVHKQSSMLEKMLPYVKKTHLRTENDVLISLATLPVDLSILKVLMSSDRIVLSDKALHSLLILANNGQEDELFRIVEAKEIEAFKKKTPGSSAKGTLIPAVSHVEKLLELSISSDMVKLSIQTIKKMRVTNRQVASVLNLVPGKRTRSEINALWKNLEDSKEQKPKSAYGTVLQMFLSTKYGAAYFLEFLEQTKRSNTDITLGVVTGIESVSSYLLSKQSTAVFDRLTKETAALVRNEPRNYIAGFIHERTLKYLEGLPRNALSKEQETALKTMKEHPEELFIKSQAHINAVHRGLLSVNVVIEIAWRAVFVEERGNTYRMEVFAGSGRSYFILEMAYQLIENIKDDQLKSDLEQELIYAISEMRRLRNANDNFGFNDDAPPLGDKDKEFDARRLQDCPGCPTGQRNRAAQLMRKHPDFYDDFRIEEQAYITSKVHSYIDVKFRGALKSTQCESEAIFLFEAITGINCSNAKSVKQGTDNSYIIPNGKFTNEHSTKRAKFIQKFCRMDSVIEYVVGAKEKISSIQTGENNYIRTLIAIYDLGAPELVALLNKTLLAHLQPKKRSREPEVIEFKNPFMLTEDMRLSLSRSVQHKQKRKFDLYDLYLQSNTNDRLSADSLSTQISEAVDENPEKTLKSLLSQLSGTKKLKPSSLQ